MLSNKSILTILLISLSISFLATILISNSTSKLTANAVDVKGYVQLSISDTASLLFITLIDETINFGACRINQTTNTTMLDSNRTIDYFDNSACVNGTFPDYMILRNDGVANASITIQASKSSQDFFNDSNSWYAYAFHNYNLESGCDGALQNTYIKFNNSFTTYPGCEFLSKNNAIMMSIKTFVTINASEGGSSNIIFIASST